MPSVPLLPNRARYNLVTVHPAWMYQSLAAGVLTGFTGVRPVTAEEADPTKVDPSVVVGGLSDFTDLEDGGMFYHLAKTKRTVLVKAVDLSLSGVVASIQLVRFDDPGTVTRDIQPLMEAVPFVPFRIAPNEMIKVVSAGTRLGLFVCINEGIEQVF